jgi:hypothetical protein
MPKLVTVLPENSGTSSHLCPVYPDARRVVGLVCMIGGVGALGYQLLANHTYTWLTFRQFRSLVVGAFCGGGRPATPLSLANFPGCGSTDANRHIRHTRKLSRTSASIDRGTGLRSVISVAAAAFVFGASAAAMLW